MWAFAKRPYKVIKSDAKLVICHSSLLSDIRARGRADTYYFVIESARSAVVYKHEVSVFCLLKITTYLIKINCVA